jgi:virginiamycin B lyase
MTDLDRAAPGAGSCVESHRTNPPLPGATMSMRSLLLLSAASLAASATGAWAQPGSDFPEGPGKQKVVEVCNNCHDINRLKVGYTPEGWLTVVQMMQNALTPVSAEEWPTVMAYLIKSLP